ncbi:TetR/AcrR family transcriptional regulator [Paenibacillus tarimensis]
MPQFLPAEKEKLQHDLITAGKKLFMTQGLKKTSLEQLTQAVGIAKSTFYAFFDSKEALYLELLELEAVGMEERVWKAVEQTTDARGGIIAYLRQMVLELDTNPLTKRLITHPEEMALVTRRVTPEYVGRKMQRNVVPLTNYISNQQRLGRMIDKDPSVIVGFMRAAMLIAVHKQDFGTDIYAEVENMMFAAAADALSATPDKKEE